MRTYDKEICQFILLDEYEDRLKIHNTGKSFSARAATLIRGLFRTRGMILQKCCKPERNCIILVMPESKRVASVTVLALGIFEALMLTGALKHFISSSSL